MKNKSSVVELLSLVLLIHFLFGIFYAMLYGLLSKWHLVDGGEYSLMGLHSLIAMISILTVIFTVALEVSYKIKAATVVANWVFCIWLFCIALVLSASMLTPFF